MNYTQNYQLPQWESSDRILMDDFNDAMEKIEGGLGEKIGIVTGSYTGNGAASRVIDLGAKPHAVFFCTSLGESASSGTCQGGLLLRDHPLTTRPDLPQVTVGAEITDSGFRVYQYNDYLPSGELVYCNLSDKVYHYIAFL